jgi:hypothetical protein
MPYSFIYDLTQISKGVLGQLFDIAFSTGVHKLVGLNAKKLVKLFKIDQAIGLNLTDAITLVEDLIEVQIANKHQRKNFEKANRKALLLPHCTRSYMDRRCKADFIPEIPTYKCNGCTNDCSVNQVSILAKKKGYDVFVIPGGSCAEKILRENKYEGVLGVACGMELKMSVNLLKKVGIAGQGVFLTKNGCANTNLNLENLERVM